MEEANPETLSDLFTSGWKLFQTIENSDEAVSSENYQKNVESSADTLARCTRMVNTLGLFSSNEDLEEVSTANLRFFLLPAFLGELELKVTSKDRKTCITNALTYFRDFLKRCRDYKVTSKDLSNYLNGKQNENANKKSSPAESREEKIARYKENKSFTVKIEMMQKRLADQPNTIDDDMTREYHLDWLKLWVNKAMENITFNNREVEMLEYMESRKGKVEPVKPPSDRPLMKPILITRDMIQKQVFGAGYRNLPTMTEDEYFEKEVREGKIVLDYSPKVPADETDEVESKDSDDEDEEEKLQKARAWDDWKDTHRRGDGNKDRNG